MMFLPSLTGWQRRGPAWHSQKGFTSTHPIVHQVELHDDDLEVEGVDQLISSQINSVNREENVVEVMNRRVVVEDVIVLEL